MNIECLVSIIVPVYGTEKYLPNCIESLMKQTYTNIEIILIDDQSPDLCPDICDYYSDKDCRIIVIHQDNKGVSGARNTGILQAKGEFIMFVDSDDELMPDAVRILLQDVKRYNADIVSADFAMVNGDGKNIAFKDDGEVTIYRDDTPLLFSLRGCSYTESACAKLFRTSFIKGINFVEGRNVNEDGFFMFQCFLLKPIFVKHDITVYLYYVRSGSNSRQKFSDKYLSMIYYCERKSELVALYFPQYIEELYNMDVRVCLQLLDLLCSTTDKKYKDLQRECINTVKKLKEYHKPINEHYRILEKIVTKGLFPFYKIAVRMKKYS